MLKMKWNETMWNCPENIRNTTQFKAAAKCNAYQVQKECMQACAKADGWQNAQTNPVWTPNELLVKRSNKLHTVHSHQYHWIVYNNTTQIDTTATTIIYGLKIMTRNNCTAYSRISIHKILVTDCTCCNATYTEKLSVEKTQATSISGR